jgi:hypothetical protein
LAPLIHQLTDKAIADQQPGHHGKDLPSLQNKLDQELDKLHGRSQWI